MTVRIDSPVGLIAALPAIMGFVPSESYIPIVLNSMGGVHQVMRLELESPQEGFDRAREIIQHDELAVTMFILSVGPNPASPEWDMDKIMSLIPEKMTEVQIFAIPIFREGVPVLAVDEGGNLGFMGELPDWKNQEVTAEIILHNGATISTSELDMISMFVRDFGGDESKFQGDNVMVWAEAGFDLNLRPPNSVIGEFLTEDPHNRDKLLPHILTDLGKAFSEFAAVSRSTDGKARTEALTLAGMAAYCWGKGAHANVAFGLAQQEAAERNEDAVLAALASTMLGHGIHPEKIREICQRAMD